MSVKAKGDPMPSPWVWDTLDNDGDRLELTIAFDEATRVITGITTYRDAGCTYTRILIGLGADGTPDTTETAWDVPAGTTVLSQGQLAQLAGEGLRTIEDVLATQVTAAP